MASLLDVEQAAARFVVGLFPGREPVRGWYGEAPAPSGPYFFYRPEIAEFPDILTADVDSAGTVQMVQGLSMVTVSFSFNGGDAMGDAVKFRLALHQTQRTVDLYLVAGLLGVTAPQDMTALELGTMRTRADIRLSLSAALTLENDAEIGETQGIRIREQAHGYDQTITIVDGVPPHV